MPQPDPLEDSNSQLRLLLQDLETILHSTARRAGKWRAWQALCQAGPYGENVLPYSERALSELEAAYAFDEKDGDTLHHLAIAYHAQAWDLELSGDFAAADRCWQQALFYWKSLQACSSFWQALIEKGKLLKDFDPQTIEVFRQNLLNYLLEIHVEFIRYYYEQNQSSLAARHITIIQHARIPPAARKQLEVLVYETLSVFIPNFLVEGRYTDVLDLLDDCLQFTPSFPPPLRTYLETVQEWTEQLSPTGERRILEEIDRRVLGRWQTLQALDPSATQLLFDLASLLGTLFWRRAEALLQQRYENDAQAPFNFLGSEEDQFYQRAIVWLGNAVAVDPASLHSQFNHFLCQGKYAFLTALFSNWMDASREFEQGIQSCQKAMDVFPEDEGPRILQARIFYYRARIAIQNQGSSAEDFEEDLTKAMQLDPDNHELREFVEGLGITPRRGNNSEAV